MDGFLLDETMKAFFLNLTRIVETNPRIYWSVIFGLVACLALFVTEAVHIQNMLAELNTKDQHVLRAAIEPISDRYRYTRWSIIVLMMVWACYEFTSTKKKLGL